MQLRVQSATGVERLGLAERPATGEPQARSRQRVLALSVSEVSVELGPIRRIGDLLLFQPRPVVVPVLSRNRTGRLDFPGPQLDVLLDATGCRRPAKAALHMAKVKVGLNLPSRLLAQLG